MGVVGAETIKGDGFCLFVYFQAGSAGLGVVIVIGGGIREYGKTLPENIA